MPMKIEVEFSHYIPSHNLFAVVVYANFESLKRMPYSVILYLKDGKQCQGTLIGGRFRFKDEKEVWGLSVKSSEIQNPETATIVAIETL